MTVIFSDTPSKDSGLIAHTKDLLRRPPPCAAAAGAGCARETPGRSIQEGSLPKPSCHLLLSEERAMLISNATGTLERHMHVQHAHLKSASCGRQASAWESLLRSQGASPARMLSLNLNHGNKIGQFALRNFVSPRRRTPCWCHVGCVAHSHHKISSKAGRSTWKIDCVLIC